MSGTIHRLPKAKIQQDVLTWFFWTLPIGAIALCGWFVLHDFVFSGPTVTIYFQNAQGLQTENSMLKYRGIRIGSIQSLKLANKGSEVAVCVKVERFASNIARQGSLFWIVRPQLKLGAVSGLQTIVSGSYITVQPGTGARTNVFTGSAEAPIIPPPGVTVTLLANNLDSLESQSGIFFRGVRVGEVTGFHLGENARYVIVDARIDQDYAPLLRVDSEFWNAGGINAHVGLFSGLQISAESAETLVSGGIAFATPENYGAAATNGSVYYLSEKPDPAWETWNPEIPLGQMPEGEKKRNSLPQIGSQMGQ